MKTVFTEAVSGISRGSRVFVDLNSKSLRVGKKKKRYLIKDGKNLTDLPLLGDGEYDVIDALEEYFVQYYHSRPSEESSHIRKNPFVALPPDKLDPDDYDFGVPRPLAKARLEVFFLCAVLSGRFVWKPEWKNIFWSSENYPELVVFKEWVA